MSGNGISWTICKSAPRSRQITMPAPHRSVFLQAGCPSCRPTNSVKALKANALQHQHNINRYRSNLQTVVKWVCSGDSTQPNATHPAHGYVWMLLFQTQKTGSTCQPLPQQVSGCLIKPLYGSFNTNKVQCKKVKSTILTKDDSC